jgi:hypothetical protein
LFEVKHLGKWGLIDTSSSITVPLIYEKIEHLGNEYWGVKQGTKWAIINGHNNLVCDFIYDAMGSEVGERSLSVVYEINKEKMKPKLTTPVRKDGRQFWVNEKCQCIDGCK